MTLPKRIAKMKRLSKGALISRLLYVESVMIEIRDDLATIESPNPYELSDYLKKYYPLKKRKSK